MSVARMMQMAAAGSAGAGPAPSGWTDPDLGNASYDSVSFSVAGQDLIPSNLFFKQDGTKLYVSGNGNDTIFQYSLSEAWDVSTASYDSVSFSTAAQASQPRALFKPDGTKMYVMDNGTDSMYQYSLSSAWDVSTASYDSVSFSVAAQDATPFGFKFKEDGTKLYVVGFSNLSIFQYSLSTAWDISTASYDSVSLSIGSQETQLRDFFLSPSGDLMFIIGAANDTVYQYSLTTPFDISSASYDSVGFSVGGQEAIPNSLFFKSDGSKMYIVGSATDTIYQYSTAAAAPAEWTDPDLGNASYDSVSFSVAGQETAPQDLFFKIDGTKVYVIGSTGDDVNEYDLSTAWDVSSASYLQNFSVSAQDTAPGALVFSPDGLSMYFVGYINDNLYQYDLSTAWDVTSASYVRSFSVATQEANPRGLSFKDDGTKFYVCGPSGDKVSEYNLSSAWDISTASYSQNFSISSQAPFSSALFFAPDGASFYVISSSVVYKYDVSTAWDISTSSYSNLSFSLTSQDTSATGVVFKSDGAKMYIVGLQNDTIYQYSTA